MKKMMLLMTLIHGMGLVAVQFPPAPELSLGLVDVKRGEAYTRSKVLIQKEQGGSITISESDELQKLRLKYPEIPGGTNLHMIVPEAR